MKLTPQIIGLFTGVLMIGVFFWLYMTNQPSTSIYQYLLDIVYAGGIAWTLVRYTKQADVTPTFKSIFAQGFRCFIVVTLVMVVFTAIFYNAHPEISKEAAGYYRQSLVENKDMLPEDKEKAVATYESRFVVLSVMASVFAFLFRGVIFTAAGAVVALMRKKQQ